MQPRLENGGNFTAKKCCLHYKLDRSDIEKNDNIIAFFNNGGKGLDTKFVGTPMSVIPMFTPSLDDQAKTRIDTHVQKQLSLGNDIQSEIITGCKY